MTDNTEPQEPKDGASPSLPPKLDLRKKIIPAEGDAAAKPIVPKLKPATGPAGAMPLKPRLTPAVSAPPAASPSAPPPSAQRMTPATPTDSQTVHIQIPKAPTQAAAPAMALKTPGSSLRPAAVSPPSAPAPSSAPAPEKKKETSKIPLAAARADAPTVRATPSADGPVKTIRIRPKSATAQTQKVAEPGVMADTPPVAQAEKKKTSRISLEAALAGDQDAADDAGAGAPRPKTIRLKRPSEAATVKVTPRAAAPAATEEPPAKAAPAAKLEETSKLDVPPVASQTSPTQRKTIRVKRPTQSPSLAPTGGGGRVPVSSSTARAPIAGAPKGVPMAAMPVRPDSPNVVFPIFAFVAMVVMMVTIYMFCAQAIGPNSSYTQYSYADTGPNLGWPGKIPPPR